MFSRMKKALSNKSQKLIKSSKQSQQKLGPNRENSAMYLESSRSHPVDGKMSGVSNRQPIIFVKNCGYIPIVLVNAATFVEQHIDVEGLFQTQGSLEKVDELIQALSKHNPSMPTETKVHDVAEMIKVYLTHLSPSVIPPEVMTMLVEAHQKGSHSDYCQALLKYRHRSPAVVPSVHYVFQLLNKVANHSDTNGMDARKLATIFVIDVLNVLATDQDNTEYMRNRVLRVQELPYDIMAIEDLIQNVEFFQNAYPTIHIPQKKPEEKGKEWKENNKNSEHDEKTRVVETHRPQDSEAVSESVIEIPLHSSVDKKVTNLSHERSVCKEHTPNVRKNSPTSKPPQTPKAASPNLVKTPPVIQVPDDSKLENHDNPNKEDAEKPLVSGKIASPTASAPSRQNVSNSLRIGYRRPWSWSPKRTKQQRDPQQHQKQQHNIQPQQPRPQMPSIIPLIPNNKPAKAEKKNTNIHVLGKGQNETKPTPKTNKIPAKKLARWRGKVPTSNTTSRAQKIPSIFKTDEELMPWDHSKSNETDDSVSLMLNSIVDPQTFHFLDEYYMTIHPGSNISEVKVDSSVISQNVSSTSSSQKERVVRTPLRESLSNQIFVKKTSSKPKQSKQVARKRSCFCQSAEKPYPDPVKRIKTSSNSEEQPHPCSTKCLQDEKTKMIPLNHSFKTNNRTITIFTKRKKFDYDCDKKHIQERHPSKLTTCFGWLIDLVLIGIAIICAIYVYLVGYSTKGISYIHFICSCFENITSSSLPFRI